MFELYWHDAGSLAAVRLDRPPANAIGFNEIGELDAILEQIRQAPTCRALVFYARGRFFSAGADITLMGELAGAPDGPAALAEMSRRMQAAFAALEALPIPTFCAISGICVGGGLELALACDIRIAERNAKVGLPEAKIGLMPGAGGTQRLAAIAGLAVAKRLILTGEIISGEAAHRFGIVQDLVEAGEAHASAMALARTVAATPRHTIEAIKRCLALAPSPQGYEAEIEETLALHREPETQALIGAFLSRSRRKTKVAV